MHAHLPGMIFQYIFITENQMCCISLIMQSEETYIRLRNSQWEWTEHLLHLPPYVRPSHFFQSVFFEVYRLTHLLSFASLLRRGQVYTNLLTGQMSSQWIWRMFAESKVWKVLRLKFLRHRPPQFDPSSIGTSEDSSFQRQNWIFEIWNEYVFKYSIWEDTVYKKQY